MMLSEILKKTVIDDMNRCDGIFVESMPLKDYFDQNRDSLLMLYNNGILSASDLDYVLERKVFAEARHYVKKMAGSKDFHANDVLRKDFLAYALGKKVLMSDLMKINWSAGQNYLSFASEFNNPCLISTLRQSLLYAQPEQRMQQLQPIDSGYKN